MASHNWRAVALEDCKLLARPSGIAVGLDRCGSMGLGFFGCIQRVLVGVPKSGVLGLFTYSLPEFLVLCGKTSF